MKRIFLFIYLMIIMSLVSMSQNVTIYYNGTAQENNALVQVSCPYNGSITLFFQLKNNSSNTLTYKVKKVVIDTVPNTTNAICFAGSCFDPTVYFIPSVATIYPNRTDSTFTGDYTTNGNAGITTILYVFYNTTNPQDTVCIRVAYNGLSGINEIKRSDIVFHDAYPNPSNNATTFSYSLPKQTNSASIIVRNLLGSEVMNVQLEDLYGKKTINTSDLKEGIYFYSLRVNDKIYYTRKLVVKH